MSYKDKKLIKEELNVKMKTELNKIRKLFLQGILHLLDDYLFKDCYTIYFLFSTQVLLLANEKKIKTGEEL